MHEQPHAAASKGRFRVHSFGSPVSRRLTVGKIAPIFNPAAPISLIARIDGSCAGGHRIVDRLTVMLQAQTLPPESSYEGVEEMKSQPLIVGATVAVLSIAALGISSLHAQGAAPPASAPPAPEAPRQAPPQRPADPRVQIRMYEFEDTHEQLPYALYVSSKVKPNKKSPLIVTLHGLGGTHTTMMRSNALDLAEAGGYILVAPMGYNPRGWYGVPPGRGPYSRPAGSAPRANRPPPPNNDPANLRELSEKDVLNVLALMQKEFKIDDRRIYLMGHSMGGAGTLHLAVKYPDKWAAIAVLAPAAFGLDPASIATVPSLPVLFVHGDQDTAVPVALSRTWADVMKQHKMTYEYDELAGGDHGSVITDGQPLAFAFFAKHKKH
jgi:predicted esterase